MIVIDAELICVIEGGRIMKHGGLSELSACPDGRFRALRGGLTLT